MQKTTHRGITLVTFLLSGKNTNHSFRSAAHMGRQEGEYINLKSQLQFVIQVFLKHDLYVMIWK